MGKNSGDNPLITIFRLTDRCNQKCIFCCQKGRGLSSEPDIDQVKRDLGAMRRKGIRTVVFMQGESLLRKDFPDVARYCREIGFDLIGVATNGTRLADAGFLEELLQCGVSKFEISIHSHLEGPSKLISGRSFTWEKQCLALENLARVQDRLSNLKLNTVICRHNMDHLPELADYFFSRITKPGAVMMLKYPFIMGAASSAAGIPSFAELDLSRFLDHVRKRNLRVKFENLPLCRAPGLEHHVSEAIDRVKDIVYYSRLDKEDFYRDKNEGGDNRVLLDGCASCTLDSICRGIDRRYIGAFGVPEVCPSKKDPHEVARKILEINF